jgi:hypothetical protein
MADAFQPTTPAALRPQLLSGSAGHTSSSACFVSVSMNEVYGNGLSSLTDFSEKVQKPKTDDMPVLGDDGMYQIENEAQYATSGSRKGPNCHSQMLCSVVSSLQRAGTEICASQSRSQVPELAHCLGGFKRSEQ